MQYIKCCDIYNINFIRQNESWEKITEYFKKYKITGEVLIDFEGVSFSSPWLLPSFIELVKMKNIHFKIYHDEDMYNTLTALFISEGEDPNRLSFVEAPKVVKMTNVEKKVQLNGERIVDKFSYNDGTYTIVVGEVYGKVSHYQTINFIEYAMNILINKNGAKSFLIDFKGMTLEDSVLDVIGDLTRRMGENNIEVSVDLESEAEYRYLALYEVAHTSISNKTRFNIVRDTVRKYPSMVGILTRYKHSEKLDEFGRQGKGESSVSRIAIFKGLTKNKEGIVVAVFQTFNTNYLYTRLHWYCDHGDEELEKLEYSRVEVTLPDLGFLNHFLGKKYHFSEISQGDISESISFTLRDNGHIKSVGVTIPERAKLVFDDWGVKYNKQQLDMRIKETLENLGLPGYQSELSKK